MNDSTANATPEAAQADETPDTGMRQPDTETQAAQDNPDANPDPDQDTDHRNREAAKYRRKLRETEAERDQLHARLTHIQRAEAERLAATLLADPADLWRDGTELDTLLDKDGHLNPKKITAAAKQLVAAHPHWQRTTRTPNFDGQRSGATGLHTPTTTGWHDALHNPQ